MKKNCKKNEATEPKKFEKMEYLKPKKKGKKK
jgi:hypothetical protein